MPKTSEAQKKATIKYLQSLGEIRVRMSKEQKAAIQDRAKEQGKSVNAYVLELIDKGLQADNP